MNENYIKKEGNQELRNRIVLKTQKNPVSKLTAINLSDDYTKKDGYLIPALFIIVSGGEEREKKYFNFFKNKNYNFPRIIIQFVSTNSNGIGGLDVDKLVEEALRIKKEKEESKGTDVTDSINLVTDVDHFYSQLERNIPKCIENDFNLIISNPCFEIWLYYSYYSQIPDFNIPIDNLKISSAFKTYLGNKHKGGVDPRKAPLEIETAIANSSKNYFEDKNKIPKIFSTQMHYLAEKLFYLTRDEIESILSEQEKLKQKSKKLEAHSRVRK